MLRFLIILIIISYKSFSQGLIINASNFYLTSNSNLILSDNAKWTNNGTVTCANGSNVKFSGGGNQYIKGTNTTTFSNVYTLKTSGFDHIIMLTDVRIFGTLYLQTGNFDVTNYICDLDYTGNVSGENENARIRGTNSDEMSDGGEGSGIGTIKAIRNNPSSNVAGLGLNFTPTIALGNDTRIVRGCNAQQGTGTFTSNYSIFRWYRIQPGSGAYTPITVNNFYYWGGVNNYELNGHIESDLQMFQKVQYGAGNPIYWQPRSTTVTTGSDYVNSTTTNDAISLNYILITLGSTSKPLPVELISLIANCDGNKNTLTWQTFSETNNKGFEIQKSPDAQEWEIIGFIEGQGNSNSMITYSFNDINPYYPNTYYRLLQIDNNGESKYSQIVQATCSSENYNEDFQPIISNGQLSFLIQGIPNNNYKFLLTNSIGQTLFSNSMILSEPMQNITTNIPVAAGIYYFTMISEKNIISKPILIKN
ncbi:MAG: hypothetical protein HPY79_03790 [Bacteroidales bacterium]|nr:hypothetical protein [Bacteroidales bacterium]